METNPEANLISIAASAIRLGVSTRTITRLIQEGQLRALKIRRRRLVLVTSIDQLVQKKWSEQVLTSQLTPIGRKIFKNKDL